MRAALEDVLNGLNFVVQEVRKAVIIVFRGVDEAGIIVRACLYKSISLNYTLNSSSTANLPL